MNDLDKITQEQRKWAAVQFPRENVQMKLAHLKEEVEEVLVEPSDLKEWADVANLFFDALLLQGFTTGDLLEAMYRKVQICKAAKWHFAEDLGYYKRIKE